MSGSESVHWAACLCWWLRPRSGCARGAMAMAGEGPSGHGKQWWRWRAAGGMMRFYKDAADPPLGDYQASGGGAQWSPNLGTL